MNQYAAVSIAFLALGANVLAAGLHLLFNPSNRVARWFIGWTGLWIIVMLAQGMMLIPGTSGLWDWLFTRALFMLPAAFVAVALVMARGWGAGAALCPLGCWAALMFVTGGDLNRGPDWFEYAWYGMWIWGVATMWGCSKSGIFPGKGGRLTQRLLIGTLFLFAPVTIAASLIGANWYGLYVAPLSSIVLQFLVFLGVIHFRFYDVEVTSARRGDIAARAAEAERLAVVGELAASVAHEIRNPLTGVRSLAQRLADDTVDEEKRRSYARVILDETQRVEDIVTSLLNLTKGTANQDSEKTPTELAPLFADLALLMTKRAEDGGTTIEVDANDITVVASRDALSQALLNLLLNALRHTPHGGRVGLLADRNGDSVDILVRDSGPGIPYDERDQVFEPFHTTSGGSGLGLAVVRRLAREQGWRVSVGDSPTGGAEFCVQIES